MLTVMMNKRIKSGRCSYACRRGIARIVLLKGEVLAVSIIADDVLARLNVVRLTDIGRHGKRPRGKK
jgi:hypothetical protein